MMNRLGPLPQLASAQTCSGCTACFAICPKRAISLVQDVEGFRYPQIDSAQCIRCGACETVCPVQHPSEPREPMACYAAYTRDESIRLASSSGGLFTEFAKPILAKNGIIFGCRLNEDLVAEHGKAESLEALAALRGSKYVQSDLKDTFREAKAALQAGRQVLFSGTPCQIAGLNAFLGKDYPNLIALEVICHGTPSPAVFEKFKTEMSDRFGSRMTKIFFRNKRHSWKRCDLAVTFTDSREHFEPMYDNPYIKAFLSDLSLRPSCYSCLAKNGRSYADVTLADFWGIEKVFPEMDDDRGISAVMLHTQKAKLFWECISSGLTMHEVTFREVTRGNPSYLHPVVMPRERNFFMKHFHTRPLISLYTRSIFGPWYIRLARKLFSLPKRILRKVYHLLKGRLK